MKNTSPKKLAALAIVPLMVALFAGCAAAPTENGTSSSSSQSKITDYDDWEVAYTSCMRDEGQDIPEGGVGAMTLSEENRAAFSAANDTCTKKLGERPTRPGEGTVNEDEAFEQALATAKCFRDNGVDVPDPTAGSRSAIPSDAPAEIIEKCAGVTVGTPSDNPNG